MTDSRPLVCPLCGASELCFGYIGNSSNVFVPSGVFTIHGFRTRSFACLSCGHVSQFVPRDKLEKLREKFHEHDEAE